MNSNKKIKFNEDGTTQTIYQEIRETALECKDVSSLADTNASSRDTCSTASRAEKSKIRKKRKFEKLNAIENVYLKEKFGGNEMNLNKKEGDLEVGSKSNTENLDKEMEKIDNPATAVTTESKAKTAALHYLDTFTKDKANWKFQKVRQVWILQNMYFSKQMNNEQFKDCLAYLKGMGDKLKKKTVEEAKELLASAEGQSANDVEGESTNDPSNATENEQQTQHLADTTKKRCKKIIKIL